MPSNVDHPLHYGGESNPYEAIKIIEAHGLCFHLGNAIKYILRAGRKTPDSREDIEKAIWYLQRYIDTYRTTDRIPVFSPDQLN